MKTKLLTLALFGILTLGALSCSQEEIAPTSEIQVNEKASHGAVGPGLAGR